ncbi:uncharacterized protein LOC134310155 [Trichomycterus rosablanca]|uniref:uncharacterized protein LOC134310153 n=1 Tax=Trichomycterus rosablanca TaxID=2290929 RepID=UPI002F35DFC1
MTAPQKFLLRVNVTTDSAWKLTLTQRPASIDELKRIMQEKFKPRLDGVDFSLQYEDPDFDGMLTVLTNIEELPEKGMLKVVRSESDDNSSLASSDTEILPHVPLNDRQKHWPNTFVVPAFSFEVEHVLEEGNQVYREYGKRLKLTRSQTHCVLDKMAETIYSYKPYPNESQLAKAAEALVNAHPCLTEHGSHIPWYGWKVRLTHKMGNYRTIMAKSGCAEVAVNTGRRSKNNPDSAHPHSNIKKARRSEINFLPNFPKGENQTSLEQMRLQVMEESEKMEINQMFIEKCMQTTFALRRQEIVKGDLLVKDLLIRWPALQTESQVFAEFHRITNVNLRNTFYAEFDRHTPTLIGLYRQKASRTGKIAESLQKILRAYDIQEEQDIHVRRILSLRALSIYLREDDSDLFKSCNQDGEPDVSECPLALLTASEDIFTPGDVSVVVEGNIVMSEIPKMLDAFLLLFGLIYVFNIEYPKKLENTFTFIQKIMVCLDDQTALKPCLLTLKNELFKE